MDDLKDLAEELMTLNDEHLAQRVIDDSDVQWCLSELYDILSADVAPVVHGRWMERDDGFGGTCYVCSKCAEEWSLIDGTPMENNMCYCPRCGAKMDEEETDR